jgi:transposase
MSPSCYVGVDISKASLEVGTWPKTQLRTFSNQAQGYAQLLAYLDELSPQLVVMEATGGYELDLAVALSAAQREFVVINPRQVRDFAKSDGTLAKSDALDATILARYGQAHCPQPRPLPSAALRELGSLVTRRRQVQEMITAERHRRRLASAEVRADIDEHLAYLQTKLHDLDQRLRQRIASNSEWQEKAQLLGSAKGVGPVLGVKLIAHLPELGRLTNREIASLVGVAPFKCQSGPWQGQAHIWGGRADVRTALYMATLSAIRYNPVIRAHYHQLVGRGKPSKVALVACMHKLLVTLNAMLRNGTPWEANWQPQT